MLPVQDELQRILLDKHPEDVFDQSVMRRPGSAPPQSKHLPGLPRWDREPRLHKLNSEPVTRGPAALPAGLAGGE